MTVGELLDRISSEELTEWAAFYRIQPFGMYRADIRSAMICSTLANIHATKGHSYTPSDFMPQFDRDARPTMTGEEILNRFKLLAGG